MWRSLVLGLGLAMVCGAGSAQADEIGTGLIPPHVAQRYGLTRAWFTQVDMNRVKARITHVGLFAGLILAQTDQGTVQAIDSETGQTLWVQQFGQRNWPMTSAGANDSFVAVANGTTLYVVDRTSGDLKWSRSLTGIPTAGVALTDGAVYVPLQQQLVVAYTLRAPEQFPRSYESRGRSDVTPIVTQDSVVWPTERGVLYVVPFGGAPPRFAIEVRGGIVSAPSFSPPSLVVGTLDGFVYSIDEFRGQILWRFLAGQAVRQTPVINGDGVYAVPERGGMYRVNAQTGFEEWFTPGISKFRAASPTRIYAADALGRLTILDAKTGSPLATLPMNGYSASPINTRNDRIVLATDTGLIQSLHEVELDKPIEYVVPKPVQTKPPVPVEKPEGEAPAEGAAPAEPGAAP